MKLSKKIFFILGLIIIISGAVYGYLEFRRHIVRNEFKEALDYYNSGKVRIAAEHFQNVNQKVSDTKLNTDSLYYMAKCYLNLDELGKAKSCWSELNDMSINRTKKAECLFNLAVIDKETGKIESAVEQFSQLAHDYPESNLADDALWNLAVVYNENNKLLKAKEVLDSIIESYPQSNIISSVQEELGNINMDLLFSPIVIPGTTAYVVQKGDTIAGIAKKYNTTVDAIKKCNNMKSAFIKPGKRLKIINSTFSIVVDKNRNTLMLKAARPESTTEQINEEVVKIYPVGTGTEGSTPVGEFKIINKLINPPWYKPNKGIVPYGDPGNVLGTRWMGFDARGYGIHGTWEPETVGAQLSAGCIRMYNKDVEELFSLVPVGTRVTVVE